MEARGQHDNTRRRRALKCGREQVAEEVVAVVICAEMGLEAIDGWRRSNTAHGRLLGRGTQKPQDRVAEAAAWAHRHSLTLYCLKRVQASARAFVKRLGCAPTLYSAALSSV